MLLLSQTPGGALSARRCPSTLAPFAKPNSPLFSKSKGFLPRTNPNRNLPPLSLAAVADGDGASSSSRPSPFPADDALLVSEEELPSLEGVIQFEKAASSSSQLANWGKVAFLAGGDALFLLIFSAIGRYNHGFPVLDFETVRTADPFMAGWFLSAYFLGGYSEDGRGENGLSKATLAAAKSWAVGIPLGVAIRTLSLGRIPPTSFMLVTMGSTAVFLVGWRTLLHKFFPSGKNKSNDVYRRGNPFELFELLTSLIRRW